MCTNPLMLPCVISYQWRLKSWQALAENLFALDPIKVIRDHATGYLDRRFNNDLKHITGKYVPVEPAIAYHAVNCTRRTGITYDKAKAKLRTEIEAEAKKIGKGDLYIDRQLDWRDAELDGYARPEHFREVEQYERELVEIKNGRGPLGAKLLKHNVDAIQRIVDAFLTGYGTLITTKLLSSVETPESTIDNVTDDIAPGALVKASSTVASVTTTTTERVTLATGETVDVNSLSANVQRDIRRGFGVANLVVNRNPTVAGPYRARSHTTQIPPVVDYTQVIRPNGTMHPQEYRRLIDSSLSTSHRGQAVLKMDVSFYSSGPDYTEYVIKGARVCPAPPSIIAMYRRATAIDTVRNDHQLNVDTRQADRVTKRKRDVRDNGIEQIAKRRVEHMPAGVARDQEYERIVDRLTYRARQQAIRDNNM